MRERTSRKIRFRVQAVKFSTVFTFFLLLMVSVPS